MNAWRIPNVADQRDFFLNKVENGFLKSGKKVAVIISDALRYEVAEEFTRRIDAENRFTASVNAQLGVLPSYTQLGMAALLPHARIAFNTKSARALDDGLVLVDDHASSGTGNRDAILQTRNGHAIQAKDLLAMNTGEARELVKSCDVLYVYHDEIDKEGDTGDEDQVFSACESTITTLITVAKKLTNANINNILVTADHGFLYQHSELDAGEWLSQQPHGDAVWMRKRRFTTGAHLIPNDAFMTVTAQQVGLANPPEEGVTVQLPNSILRLHHHREETDEREHQQHPRHRRPWVPVPAQRTRCGRMAQRATAWRRRMDEEASIHDGGASYTQRRVHDRHSATGRFGEPARGRRHDPAAEFDPASTPSGRRREIRAWRRIIAGDCRTGRLHQQRPFGKRR